MSRRKIPIPEDFRETARKHFNSELANLYGVSKTTIQQWRKEADAPAVLRHRFGAIRLEHTLDTPEEVRMCLNCQLQYCDGNCTRMKLSKRGASVCYT